MFGLFRKKKFVIECPMCGRTYDVKFDPTQVKIFDYAYRPSASSVSSMIRSFCKTQVTIVMFKSGQVKAYNDKWQKIESDYNVRSDVLVDEIAEIEDGLAEEPGKKSLEKKLQTLNKRLEKVEDSFEKKEERYLERQERWHEKWEDKINK